MIQKALEIARSFGIYIYRGPNPYHVITDYPVSDKPRYGYKTPVHPLLAEMIEERREDYRNVLHGIGELGTLIDSIPYEESDAGVLTPYWNSGWLPPRDGAAIMHFILSNRPARFFEIGSGNSTKFARLAIEHGNLNTEITSIDPQPRAEIDQLCKRVIRSGLEDVDLSLFDELKAGDILSFDGSHRLFADSDVAVFFLEVLPRISPGVVVQVHDIFWPMDYPLSWGHRFYSEQYMLGLLLILGRDKLRILLANAFVDQDEELRRIAAPLLPSDTTRMGRFGEGVWANAFWFRLETSLA